MIKQADDAGKAQREPATDMPGHRKAKDQAQDPDVEAHRGIFGQMDIF